jgi:hypothetical protein
MRERADGDLNVPGMPETRVERGRRDQIAEGTTTCLCVGTC